MANLVYPLCLCACSALGQSPTPIFDIHQDIGAVAHAGQTSYNAETENYTLKSSGKNLWYKEDEFHFACKKFSGDFILYARLAFIGDGTDPHRKAGVMIRKGLDPGSAYADIAVHGDGLTSLQFRAENKGETKEIVSVQKHFEIIQLQKVGDIITILAAHIGEPLQPVGSIELAFGDDFYIGLFGCSHNIDVIESFTFTNVRLTIPVKKDFVPYKDFLGSRLETLDVVTGQRKIVYESKIPFEAPNWTPDGNWLIVNSKGKLYRIPVGGGQPEEINTDFAIANNNDHGLSADGKWLAISHHAADQEGQSTIYILPSTGGVPRKVTDKTPSYWHGWSPDNKYLVYTGERGNQFDIYKIAALGGAEERLSNAIGLDDGPEYSPDGKTIYFNSNRTGTMQIWKMKPDGSGQQQITFDEYNDWFPHVSPDGRSILFISYPATVASDDHPYYKHVMLRALPLRGGAIRVVAHVYGGQGTFNVPSWSPDGSKVAFVSNSN